MPPIDNGIFKDEVRPPSTPFDASKTIAEGRKAGRLIAGKDPGPRPAQLSEAAFQNLSRAEKRAYEEKQRAWRQANDAFNRVRRGGVA